MNGREAQRNRNVQHNGHTAVKTKKLMSERRINAVPFAKLLICPTIVR